MQEKVEKRLEFVVNALYVAVVVLLAYLSVKYVMSWILPFLVAFLIVSFVHPLIRRIKRWIHWEREIVTFVVMVLIYLVVFALLVGVIALLVVGLQQLFDWLPSYYDQVLGPGISDLAQSFVDFLQDLPEEFLERFDNIQAELLKSVQGILLDISQKGISSISRFTGKIPSFMLGLLFTVMLSFFISMQYYKVLAFLRRLFPPPAIRFMVDLKKVMRKTVLRYLRATLTLMLITAGELSVGLLVLGTPYFLPVACGIAVFDALPFVGTGAIMIPWAIIELIKGNYFYGAGIAILYGVVTVVRNIIEPKIISDKLGLNPIVSLCSIYLGFRLFGVLGMIAMPIVAQIIIALYQNDSLPFLDSWLPPRTRRRRNSGQ